MPKLSFGFKDIPYLIYVITQYVIIPDPKKVQGVVYFGRPTTMSEARAPIGVVQHYRNMCPRKSHILDLLTEEGVSPKCRNIGMAQ